MGHPGIIKSLAFNADGRMFFSGSADRIVRVWDTPSRKVLFSLEGHTDAVESLEPSEGGRTLISRSENEEIVWDVQRGLKLNVTSKEQRFEDQTQKAFSPSGKLALLEEYEKPFRLVDPLTNRTIKEFIFIDQLDNLAFCPDENTFLQSPGGEGGNFGMLTGANRFANLTSATRSTTESPFTQMEEYSLPAVKVRTSSCSTWKGAIRFGACLKLISKNLSQRKLQR
jgi:WD40 repeat protein